MTKKKKILQRLLIFILGIPASLSLVLIGWGHHLPLQIVMVSFSLLGTAELHKMFTQCEKPKILLPPLMLVLFLDAFIISSPYVLFLLRRPTHYVCYVFMLCVMLLLTIEALRHGKDVSFEHSAAAASLTGLILFYCGYMFSFMVRLSVERYASKYLLLFLVIVFICDSAAWLFGILLGKGNRNIAAASPNKSAAGFIGGIAGSIIVSAGMRYFLPSWFGREIWRYVLLAVIVSVAAIVGDLVESVFKRSAGVKDSGNMMLGRGGILDSIDSILFSIPVYYLVVRHLI